MGRKFVVGFLWKEEDSFFPSFFFLQRVLEDEKKAESESAGRSFEAEMKWVDECVQLFQFKVPVRRHPALEMFA